jgi:hypothetical protein
MLRGSLLYRQVFRSVIAIIVLLPVSICCAQPPGTMWTQVYPGIGEPRIIESTADGGFILPTTFSIEAFSHDIALNKIDGEGGYEWFRYYDTDNWTTPFDIQQTRDGGFIIVGDRFGSPHHFDYATYVIRTDANGDTLWTREYNLDDDDDHLFAVLEMDDGYLCAGKVSYIGFSEHEGDILLMRLNDEGDTLWTKRYGTAFPDEAKDIVRISDDRILIAGTAGDSQSLTQLPTEAYALMIDDAGDTLWTRKYSNDAHIYTMDAESDGEGGFYITGTVEGEDPRLEYPDVYAMRGDSMGNLLWQHRFGNEFNQLAFRIKTHPLGGTVVFGGQSQVDTITSKSFALRLNDEGDELWTELYGTRWSCWGVDGLVLPEGGYVMMALQHANDAPPEEPMGLVLIRTHPEIQGASDLRLPIPKQFILLSAYPNPFNSITTIALSLPEMSDVNVDLYDITGRNVKNIAQDRMTAGEHSLQVDAAGLPSGIYFVKATTGEFQVAKKIVLVK